jgi:hypothetical protein
VCAALVSLGVFAPLCYRRLHAECDRLQRHVAELNGQVEELNADKRRHATVAAAMVSDITVRGDV